MAGGAAAFKASAAGGVALPAGAGGGLRLTPNGARVLEVLAGSSVPLGVSELLERTGLKRRTLFWWLARLADKGYVERIGRKRCVGTVYAITREGLRLLAYYRSNLERVQSRLRTAVSGAARALWGDGGGAACSGGTGVSSAAADAGGSAGGVVSAGGSAASVSVSASAGGVVSSGVVVARERVALCVLRGGRWVPVVELGLVDVRGLGRMGRIPWWVEADGGNGFREVGFRASYRRLRRLFRLLGVEMPKRVKRVVVYAKGKEVHVDAATKVPLDEIVTAGAYAAWRQYLLAFAGSALALMSAGFDRRFLQLVVAVLSPA